MNNSSSWEVREKEESTDNDLIFQTLDWYNTDITNEETDLLEYTERCDINEPVTSEEIPEIVDEVIEYEPLDTDVSDNSDEESDEENYNYYNTFED